MEDHRVKDLTLAIFQEIADEPEFRGSRNLGIVLQAYLRETEADARRLVDWARRRGTPVCVRLVKGAYWDYEVAHARLEHWPVPVWEIKRETDAEYERITRVLEASDAIDLAIGSQRALDRACARGARAQGIPARRRVPGALLHGVAARARPDRAWRARADLHAVRRADPRHGDLVRRLLENTSQESFLRRGSWNRSRSRSCWRIRSHPHVDRTDDGGAATAGDFGVSRRSTSPSQWARPFQDALAYVRGRWGSGIRWSSR